LEAILVLKSVHASVSWYPFASDLLARMLSPERLPEPCGPIIERISTTPWRMMPRFQRMTKTRVEQGGDAAGIDAEGVEHSPLQLRERPLDRAA
jgi:hypothetical protein